MKSYIKKRIAYGVSNTWRSWSSSA
jgi:hypothetical protein